MPRHTASTAPPPVHQATLLGGGHRPQIGDLLIELLVPAMEIGHALLDLSDEMPPVERRTFGPSRSSRTSCSRSDDRRLRIGL